MEVQCHCSKAVSDRAPVPLDEHRHLTVPLLQPRDLLAELLDVRGSVVVVVRQVLRVHDARLLPQLPRLGPVLVALVLRLGDEVTLRSELLVQLRQLRLQGLVLLLHELHLLAHVSDDLHRGDGFLPQLVQLLVSLFDLFVQRLILDLQLLEVDDVEILGELVLFPKSLLQLCKSVLQRDVGAAHLLDLRVLVELELLDLLNDPLLDLLAVAGVLGVARHLPLELLE
mmetsp:Transcript_119776/g.335414  ORF Transcript_119776/g.335414 Transcript_119776/m.335414 type:complete len:227 (-) Transcript_119776:528-1208(-)